MKKLVCAVHACSVLTGLTALTKWEISQWEAAHDRIDCLSAREEEKERKATSKHEQDRDQMRCNSTVWHNAP